MADGLSVELETKDVTSMIDRLLKRVEKPKILLRNMQRYIHALTMKMFRGRRPDRGEVRGVRWPKNKPSTIQSKRAALARGDLTGGVSDRPMVESGKTRDSHKVLEESRLGFTYGTRTKSPKGFGYPGYHNNNDYPWLFLTKNKDFPQFIQMAVDHLEGALKRHTHYMRGAI